MSTLTIPSVEDAQIEAFRPDYRGKARRSIEATWPIGGQAAGEDGHYLSLTASHFEHRRDYTAQLMTHELCEQGTIKRAVFDFGGTSAVIASEPVARYSQKSLRQFFDAAMRSDGLRESMEQVVAARSASLDSETN